MYLKRKQGVVLITTEFGNNQKENDSTLSAKSAGIQLSSFLFLCSYIIFKWKCEYWILHNQIINLQMPGIPLSFLRGPIRSLETLENGNKCAFGRCVSPDAQRSRGQDGVHCARISLRKVPWKGKKGGLLALNSHASLTLRAERERLACRSTQGTLQPEKGSTGDLETKLSHRYPSA